MAAHADGSIVVDTELDAEGFKSGSSELQQAVKSLVNKVDSLGPTFQRALDGSGNAVTSYQAKATALENTIVELESKMAALGTAEVPTDEFAALSAAEEKAGKKLEELLNKQEKMQATGVSENSAQWKSLSYDLQVAAQNYDNLAAAKARMETSGTAYQMGSQTVEYQRMNAALTEARNKLAAMNAEAGKSKGSFKSMVSSLVSGLKSAVSSMSKLIRSNSKYKQSFGGVLSSIKRIGPALLATEGILGLLRKAVNAYMSANETLANTLSSCWSGIGNLLGPIIERLVNLIASAVAYFTAFLSLLGIVGKSTSKAISGAGGGASKETDKLKRQLASFDELNILSDNESDGGGGGGGTTARELPEVNLPDWAQLMVEQVKSGKWALAAQTLTDQLNIMVASVNWAGIGDSIGYYLNGALTFLATALLTFNWFGLGADLAISMNGVISGIDWQNLGALLMSKWVILIDGLGGFFHTLDWASLGRALADALWGMWAVIDWGQAARTISDGVKGALTGISSAIKNINWAQFGAELWNALVSIVMNTDWTGLVSTAFDLLGAAIGGATSLISGIAKSLWDSLVSGCEETYKYFESYIEAAGGDVVQGLWNGIVNALSNIGQWIKNNIFAPFINGFKAAFGIHSPSTVMAEQGSFIIEGLLNGITSAWSAVTTFFSTALSNLTSAISTCWSNIKSGASKAWSGIKTTVTNAWIGLKTNVTNAYTAVKNGMSTAWTNIKSATSTAWSNVKTTVTNAWNGIKSTSSSIGSSVASAVSSAWSKVKSYVSTNLTNAKNSASTLWNSMKSTVGSTLSNISSSVSSKFSGIYSTISSKISSVKSSVVSGFNSVKSDIVSKMSSAMSTIKNQGWYSVGSNICTGIKNGINNGWSWLKSTVSNLAKNLLSAAKSALGIHSPSRLFRDAVGLNIGLGVGEGIEASEGSVLGSVTSVADAIAEEFNAGEYEAANIIPTTQIDGALTSFSDKISDNFSTLLNKLQAIAESVTFRVPAAAGSMMPYKVAATGGANMSDINAAIEASNDELISVIIQNFTNQTAALVAAIKQYSGATVNFDEDTITTAVIREINRRTRMTGQSPILG